MRDIIYPFSPGNVDKKVLIPTKEYKKEAIRVTASILFFALVYLLLVILSTALAATVSYFGVMLIIFRPSFITLMIGIGMIGLGIMVMFFLFKFIFSIKKVDRSGLCEIHKKDYPELFSFVKQLATETKAPMPKRIYLTPEVNASVFYDSNLLSMFFPARKNLMIGLGFVNSVNMSEFKAVLAHEFGHFSQDSMRLGSYVYNVNKIIYNVLYDNEGYASTIDSWASASSYFSLFAALTVKIVQSIQWILQKVYTLVNITNLSLSRQMEHHADAVSAFVSGPGHIIMALKRLELSDLAYNILLSNYDRWISENLKPDNIFTQHREVLMHISAENNFETENGLPVIDSRKIQNIRQSRIVVKDQWSTHPAISDRENFVRLLNIENTNTLNESPWCLFNDPEQIQRSISELLFTKVKFPGATKILSFDLFKEKYHLEFRIDAFNKEYNGFYDNRRIKPIEINQLMEETEVTVTVFNEFFSVENTSIPRDLDILKSELETLKSLRSSQNKKVSFIFDGRKCTKSDIPDLIELVENETAALQSRIDDLDKQIIKATINKAEKSDKEAITELYANFFSVAGETDSCIENYTRLSKLLSPIYESKIHPDDARHIIKDVKSVEKQTLHHINSILDEAREQKYLDEEQFKKMDLYLKKDRDYFDGTRFNNVELDIFCEAMNLFMGLMHEREFRAKKKMLKKQFEVLS